MIKSVVITGATSSIGTALIQECINQKINVLALVNPESRNISRIDRNPQVEIKECSLNDLCHFDTEGKYDAFIHLAWAATAGDIARNQLVDQAMNIKYSLDAVDLANRLGCDVFVGSGSQAEYGRTDKVLTETLETKPETAYGMAKLCAGQMTRLACSQKGIRHIWPRILSAYGPKCQPQSVINYTLTELLLGEKPSLSGGDQIWDFIYTGDVARALMLLLEKGRGGETYVIGSGVSKRLKEYLLEVRDIVNPSMEMGFGEIPYSNNSVMHLACDISKLKADVGFEPRTSFREGISKTIEWIESTK